METLENRNPSPTNDSWWDVEENRVHVLEAIRNIDLEEITRVSNPKSLMEFLDNL